MAAAKADDVALLPDAQAKDALEAFAKGRRKQRETLPWVPF